MLFYSHIDVLQQCYKVTIDEDNKSTFLGDVNSAHLC